MAASFIGDFGQLETIAFTNDLISQISNDNAEIPVRMKSKTRKYYF